jgi:hypothetical protein
MAHRGEVVTDNEEERRKNAGGPQAQQGPPPAPDSPEAVNARAEQGKDSHAPVTPGASGSGAGRSDTADASDPFEVERASSEEGK